MSHGRSDADRYSPLPVAGARSNAGSGGSLSLVETSPVCGEFSGRHPRARRPARPTHRSRHHP
ncbi:hypothetical protein FS847_04715 [Streptomyces sp. ISID311]|nr:hypothetical protein FS847_04715 [Streptomyces sp. ISID311]